MDPDRRTNYVFYDPTSFEKQAEAEAARMPVDIETKQEEIRVSGGGVYYKPISVSEKTVMIPITTEQEFIDAWNNMDNPTDVTLIFHVSATTLNIDYKNVQYLTTNPKCTTPKGNSATYIGNLVAKNIGTLKIYSCQSGNLKEQDNVGKCFKKFNTIQKVYASDGSLSFKRGSYEPKVSNEGKREYKKKYGQDPVGLVEIK